MQTNWIEDKLCDYNLQGKQGIKKVQKNESHFMILSVAENCGRSLDRKISRGLFRQLRIIIVGVCLQRQSHSLKCDRVRELVVVVRSDADVLLLRAVADRFTTICQIVQLSKAKKEEKYDVNMILHVYIFSKKSHCICWR